MGTELAKFAIEIVGFMMARILKPIFLMLCARMIHPLRAFSIYFKAIIFSNSLGFQCDCRRLHVFA
jgi:hypothetical protein